MTKDLTTTYNSYRSGFTLIELLVVISIIGILAALTMVSFTQAQKQARDTQRQADLKQYQNLLETFASQEQGFYPSRTGGGVEASTLCLPGPIRTAACPKDPQDPAYQYRYISNGSGGASDASLFVLWAYQESSDKYFIICSAGRTGTDTIAPPSFTCPPTLK